MSTFISFGLLAPFLQTPFGIPSRMHISNASNWAKDLVRETIFLLHQISFHDVSVEAVDEMMQSYN